MCHGIDLKPENHLWESVLSFCVHSSDVAQEVRPGGEHLYPQSHLVDPRIILVLNPSSQSECQLI